MALYLTQYKKDKHDLDSLKRLYPEHEIRPVFDGPVSISNMDTMAELCRDRLRTFQPVAPSNDKIVFMGVGIAQALCLSNLIMRFDSVPAVIWNAVERRYVEAEFNREKLEV